MGFLFLAIEIPKAISITFILNLLSHLRFILIGALTRLGLFKPSPEEDSDSGVNFNNYVLILDSSSPSLVPIPVHVVTAAIRDRVPVVTYADFMERHRDGVDEERERVCTICLDYIQRGHQIRELFNCSHVFHRDCLDTWVDEGQVTCPLCRSMLLPPKCNLTRPAAAAAAAASSSSAGGGGPVSGADPASVGEMLGRGDQSQSIADDNEGHFACYNFVSRKIPFDCGPGGLVNVRNERGAYSTS